jgi:hypothetical protein
MRSAGVCVTTWAEQLTVFLLATVQVAPPQGLLWRHRKPCCSAPAEFSGHTVGWPWSLANDESAHVHCGPNSEHNAHVMLLGTEALGTHPESYQGVS